MKRVVVEKQQEKTFSLCTTFHFFCCSSLRIFFFVGVPATWDALRRGKSLPQEDPSIRTDRDWWKRNKDDDYYFSAKQMETLYEVESEHWHTFQCMHAPSPTDPYTDSPPQQQQKSQHQTQKTAQLSIQSDNCFLKLIKIARLDSLLLVSSGSLSPVPQSFPTSLSFQLLLVQASPSLQRGFIFLCFLP